MRLGDAEQMRNSVESFRLVSLRLYAKLFLVYGSIDRLIKTEGSSDNCLAQPSYLMLQSIQAGAPSLLL